MIRTVVKKVRKRSLFRREMSINQSFHVPVSCFPVSSRAPLPMPKGARQIPGPQATTGSATSFKTTGITSIVKLVLNMRDHFIFNFGEIAAQGL